MNNFSSRTCKDCKQGWFLLPEEELYFRKNGLKDPKRCKPCRAAAKRAARAEGEAYRKLSQESALSYSTKHLTTGR